MTLRVLLIDENEDRADAVRISLLESGCDVVGVMPHHADLIRHVRAAAADVIVCDVDDPSRDTIESMRALNRDEPRPVVMFVDRSDPTRIADAMEAGVAAYVIEGLAPGRVRAVIDVAVARFRGHPELKSELARAKSALNERKLIERAKGILMDTRNMSEDEAYRTMRRLAMDQGKRLVDVASTVVSLAQILRES